MAAVLQVSTNVTTMKASKARKFGTAGKIISAAIVVAAGGLAYYAATTSKALPTTDAASIDAEVVHVAAAVGGRIIQIGVHENSRVKKGELLFQIDPLPYQLLVAQAQADLDLATAGLETQKRYVSTQRSSAEIAAGQVKTAHANYELAARTAARLRPLNAKGYVPGQQLDQADVTARDAATAYQQAMVQKDAAEQAIDTVQAGESAVAAREAALALAKRNLEETTVRAAHDGLVVGLTVSTGEMIAPSQTLFTLINTEEWTAVADLRETDLSVVHMGDCATVYSMLDRRIPIKGRIEGIGWGVLDTEQINLPRGAPYVQRSLNWVRVAQRFPVRVRLESPPEQLMRLGASAVVEVKHGSQCR
jgi:multidrug efflux system membrane fusion protein